MGAHEADMPKHNSWVTRLCRRASFRPRFVQDVDSLVHEFSLILSEGAVSLLPDYSGKTRAPGVVFRRLKDPAATCELMVAWQRGKVSAPVKTLLAALPAARVTKA